MTEERMRAVGLGAILVPGKPFGDFAATSARSVDSLLSEPLGYLDVTGRSTVERTIERFVRAEVNIVSVLQDEAGFRRPKPCFTAFENVEFQTVIDPYAAIRQKLREYSRSGIEHSFLLFGDIYAETDLLDLFYFHREARQIATRTMTSEGALDFWVLDCPKATDIDLHSLFMKKVNGSSYFIREYVNRLIEPRDLRRLASDLLQGRCWSRPSGREVKRGIWIDEGAEVHRWARIVAPAYIGRGCKIMEDTLITRHSCVEKNCSVDYGTVVEKSSVLQDTEIGICLDVCHAVASGNKFLSLDRDVVIEISDPAVMRSNSPLPKPAKARQWARTVLSLNRRKEVQSTPAEFRPAASAPERRGLQTNPMKG
jgi:carbonic anhydrase/acetyltransferase-like protein (isoleucine patch superfamily)